MNTSGSDAPAAVENPTPPDDRPVTSPEPAPTPDSP